MYKFLCQNCLNVVVSDDWKKYHLTDNSCPKCAGDMCGCKSCLDIIEEKIKSDSKIYNLPMSP